jgi:hypothetical protein
LQFPRRLYEPSAWPTRSPSSAATSARPPARYTSPARLPEILRRQRHSCRRLSVPTPGCDIACHPIRWTRGHPGHLPPCGSGHSARGIRTREAPVILGAAKGPRLLRPTTASRRSRPSSGRPTEVVSPLLEARPHPACRGLRALERVGDVWPVDLHDQPPTERLRKRRQHRIQLELSPAGFDP